VVVGELALREGGAVGVVVDERAHAEPLAQLVAQRDSLERDVHALDYGPAREVDHRRHADPDGVDGPGAVDRLADGPLDLVEQGGSAREVGRPLGDLGDLAPDDPAGGDLGAADVHADDGRFSRALQRPSSLLPRGWRKSY
jgi:hypothetical protein